MKITDFKKGAIIRRKRWEDMNDIRTAIEVGENADRKD